MLGMCMYVSTCRIPCSVLWGWASSQQASAWGAGGQVSGSSGCLWRLHSLPQCCPSAPLKGLSSSLQRAQCFLEKHLGSLTQAYSVAISSYALTLVNSSKANDVLDLFASRSECMCCTCMCKGQCMQVHKSVHKCTGGHGSRCVCNCMHKRTGAPALASVYARGCTCKQASVQACQRQALACMGTRPGIIMRGV